MGAEMHRRAGYAVALTCAGTLPASLLYFLLGVIGGAVFSGSSEAVHFWSGVPSVMLLALLATTGLIYANRIEYFLRAHKGVKAGLQLFFLFFTGFGGFLGLMLIKQGL